MNKPIFKDVLQVGVVVKNLNETVKEYADEYGIGPWIIYEFNPKTVKDMIVRDKKEDYAMRIALCNIGNVQWELIEPKDDKSIYAEFLRNHGEGLHHVAFGVENYEEAMKFFRLKGHKVLASGTTWNDFTYTYLTTQKSLKCIVEIYNKLDVKRSEPDAIYPQNIER